MRIIAEIQETIMTRPTDTDKKIATLIKQGEKALASSSEGHQKFYMNEKLFHDFRISALSFLTVVFGTKSQFYKEFYKEVTSPTPVKTSRGIGILEGARKELQGDWLTPVRAEIYGDFERDILTVAKNQIQQGIIEGGFTLAMGVLENHLQRFASQNNLPIERKTSTTSRPYTAVQLNSRIYKKGLYPRNLNKKIFKWLELQKQLFDPEVELASKDTLMGTVDQIAAFCVEYPINYLD